MTEIINAKITNTMLGFEDHGVFTYLIYLEWPGGGVGYGGYVLGGEFGCEAIKRLLNTVGVEKWEDLKGKFVRIKTEGIGTRIDNLGNILKDEWLDIQQLAEEFRSHKTYLTSEGTLAL